MNLMKKVIAGMLVATTLLTTTSCSLTKLFEKSSEISEVSEVSEESSEILEESSEASVEKPAATGDISDDLYSFQFEMDGKQYTLPFALTELEAEGWVLKEDGSTPMKPNMMSSLNVIDKGEDRMYIGFFNDTPNELPMRDCVVYYVQTGTKIGVDPVSFVFPKGITYGATEEEVIAAYGEPTDKTEMDTFSKLKYQIDGYTSVNFKLQDGKVSEIEAKNMKERPTGDAATSTGDYVGPADLGTAWSDYHVKLDGTIYKLPVSVEEFLASGWVFETDASEKIASGRTKVGVTMRKGNKTIRTSLRNYNKTEEDLTKAHVVILTADQNSDLEIEIFGGIKKGSTKDEMIAALGEPTKTEDSNTMTFYTYGKIFEEVTVTIDKESGKVMKIEVSYSPSELPV